MILTLMVSFTMTSCASKDSSDDDETYETRQYLIGVGKWHTIRVKTAGGQWSDDPYGQGKTFTIEFFDKKADDGDRKFKSWEYIGQKDPDDKDYVEYEGSYVVDRKTVTCTVNGKTHLRFLVTKMDNRELYGTATFYNENVTFDVVMERTW